MSTSPAFPESQRTLRHVGLAKALGVLVGGQAGAQLLTLAVAPLLTRLYGPQDFGTLAVFAALLAFVSVVACLRYELAIALPASDLEARNLFGLSMLCVVLVSLVTALGVLLFGSSLARTLNWKVTPAAMWLLPVGVALAGAYAVIEKWMVRTHCFKQIAQTRLLQSVTANLVQVGGYGAGVLALMAGTIVGQGAGGLFFLTRGAAGRKEGQVSLRCMWKLAVRFHNFPLFSSWTALLSIAGVHLIPMVFSALFGATVVGFFAFALRIVSAPTMLVGAALSNVILAHGPAARRDGTLSATIEAVRRKLAVVGLPALALLVIAGPDLFGTVFGERWRPAGDYARWMAPWIYFQFQFYPISSLAEVLEMQRLELGAHVLTFALRVGALAGCHAFGLAADSSVAIFCAVSALAYLAMLAVFMSQVGVRTGTILAHDLRHIGLFALCIAPALWLYTGQADLRTLAATTLFAATSAWWIIRAVQRRTDAPTERKES